jgi:photosystem II stability/assembly factor-like uncharacterized protein
MSFPNWVTTNTPVSITFRMFAKAHNSIAIVVNGTDGMLYKSTNGGNVWNQVSTQSIIYQDLCMSDDASIIYGFSGGQLTKSTDGGQTFVQTAITETSTSPCVICSSDGSVVIAAFTRNQPNYEGPKVRFSTDGGNSWNSIPNSTFNNSPSWERRIKLSISSNGSIFYAAFASSGYFVSTNTGTTWTQMSIPADAAGNGSYITCSSDGSKVLIIQYGAMAHASTDSGVTWNSTSIPVVNSPSITSDGLLMAAKAEKISGQDAGIYITNDGGANWTLFSIPNTASSTWMNDVYFTSDGSLFAFTDTSGIFRAIGSSPPPLPPGPDLTLDAVFSNTFTASWTPLTDATSYSYELSTGGGAAAAVTPSSTTSSTATFTLLSPSTSYSLVMTTNTSSSYRVSPALSVTTTAAPVPGPTLTPGTVTSNSFTASWTPVSDVTGYTYMLSTNGGAAVSVTPSSTTSSTATFSNLAAGTSYSLVITANTPSGSRVSPAFVVTTSADPTIPSWVLTNTAGSIGYNIFAKSHNSSVLLVNGTDNILYKSINNGDTWTQLPANLYSMGSTSLCMSDNASIIYTTTSILRKSTDGGQTFSQVNIPFEHNASREKIVICSSDGSIFLTTGFEDPNRNTDRLFVGTDGGNTVTPVIIYNMSYIPPNSDYVTSIAMSSNGSIMYATYFVSGCFISTDTGVTWTQIIIPDYTSGIKSYITCSSDGSKVLIIQEGIKVHISTNAGVIWTTSSFPVGTASYISANGINMAFTALKVSGQDAGIYTSSNSGNTWTLNTIPNTTSLTSLNGVSFNNNNELITFTGNSGIFKYANPSAPAPGPTLGSASISSTSFRVSWTPVSGATSYTYMLSTNGGAAVAVTPSSTTSSTATFSNLAAGTSYSLVMTANTPSGPLVSPAFTVTTSGGSGPGPGPGPGSASSSSAKSTTIRYKKVVCWGLSPSAINFAQAGSMGHRVSITIPVDLMNKFFTWTRGSGEAAPTGRFTNNPLGTTVGTNDFTSQLVNAFGGIYTDIDGVANGLNFSSSALDIGGDIKRDATCVYNALTDRGLFDVNGVAIPNGVATGTSWTHYGANDLVMAYLMYKCFGSSSYDPTDVIYNVDDAYNMLDSKQLADLITASLEAEDSLANAAVLPNGKAPPQQLPGDNKGQVDAMFRGFLAADPLRYFLNGIQIPGLFETNFTCPPSDPSVGGNWCLTVGDKIEVPLQLVFRAPVSLLSVQDNVQNPSSATPDSATTQIIAGESATFDCTTQKAALANVIPIRLQITCSSPLGAGSGSTSAPGATLPLGIATSSSAIFYTPPSYGLQTAIAVVAAGGTAPYTYSMTLPTGLVGVTINPVSGVLSFNAATATVAQWGKWAVPVTIVDSAGAPASVTKYVNVSLDDGNGASNNSRWIAAASGNIGTGKMAALAPYSASSVVQPNKTLLYSSPPYAQPANATSLSAGQILSIDAITFTYTPPSPGDLGPNMPVVAATVGATEWSITSKSGKSSSSLLLPNGVTFSGSGATATLTLTFDPAPYISGADYSIGNTAGNKTGIYNFLVTAKDSNNFVQSFPLSINIAAPPPISALVSLEATSMAANPKASYANGAVLRYSLNDPVDSITLRATNNQGVVYKWSLTVIAGDSAPGAPLAISYVNLNTSVSTQTTELSITPPATAGTVSFLVTCLDQQNVSQTIFYTVVCA